MSSGGLAPRCRCIVDRASEVVELSQRAEDNAARSGARAEGPSIEDPQDRPVPDLRTLMRA